ncbi:MAG: hypothetical protein OXO49_01955 [Gammaproteobacteria bacterium]|nr:hypothetical protein [Gammaproteobacteria bacterium]MDE0252723.1 hypothetical protein [Gammaproteobacteria bacterium]MDE0402411.1 hypothetical protein [Gammaproteobacteria bacterium]MDE0644656.1 hypothetical protein [Gammaproteobacteria bacterium]
MFYKNKIGILLATLVVALFIPNLSVVHADDEEEDEYSDEVIPPYIQQPSTNGWEEVEYIQVAIMGEYDTSWGIPDWVTKLIEKFSKRNQEIAHKEPCRIQSNWTIYRHTTNERQISKTESVTDEKRRGFFATFKDLLQWYKSIKNYFRFGVITYVDSEMRESFSTIGCTHEFVVVKNGSSEYVKESRNAFHGAPWYFEQDWEDYHLFERNCQHYNEWVLTGWDTSR